MNPEITQCDVNPIAEFEDRDGVQGVNIFGREYPMADIPSETYRTGYWRELTKDEQLIKAAAYALGQSSALNGTCRWCGQPTPSDECFDCGRRRITLESNLRRLMLESER